VDGGTAGSSDNFTDEQATAGSPGTIEASAIPCVPLTDFRDVRRPNEVTIGPDLGGTGHQALNFKGSAGAAGDTWITVYNPASNPSPVTFGSVHLSADVLIDPYNNLKGAGLLALYNEAPSTKGLALTVYSAGNTDTLVLATVDQAGKLVTLKTVTLGAEIKEHVWYRVSMDVSVDGGLVSVVGTVFRHETPTAPYSPLTTQVGGALTFSAALGAGPLVGVGTTGEVGILSAAVAAKNGSSATNFLIDPQGGGSWLSFSSYEPRDDARALQVVEAGEQEVSADRLNAESGAGRAETKPGAATTTPNGRLATIQGTYSRMAHRRSHPKSEPYIHWGPP